MRNSHGCVQLMVMWSTMSITQFTNPGGGPMDSQRGHTAAQITPLGGQDRLWGMVG